MASWVDTLLRIGTTLVGIASLALATQAICMPYFDMGMGAWRSWHKDAFERQVLSMIRDVRAARTR
jgi:hypothetical protein